MSAVSHHLPSSPPTVLVFDDSPVVRATAVQLFQDLGFEVTDAYYGEQALQLLREHLQIGLLFADVRMPGLSGPELAETALATRPGLKVVYTSGYVNGSDLPADAAFVPKPWRVEEVVEAVSTITARQQAGASASSVTPDASVL
jgi:CheY-like chemotaxis protein